MWKKAIAEKARRRRQQRSLKLNAVRRNAIKTHTHSILYASSGYLSMNCFCLLCDLHHTTHTHTHSTSVHDTRTNYAKLALRTNGAVRTQFRMKRFDGAMRSPDHNVLINSWSMNRSAFEIWLSSHVAQVHGTIEYSVLCVCVWCEICPNIIWIWMSVCCMLTVVCRMHEMHNCNLHSMNAEW